MMNNLFENIKGHDGVKSQILKAFDQKRLPHGLLFSGPSGVGKKQVALALAQKMLCETSNSCGKCFHCLSVAKKESEHVLLITSNTLNIKLSDVESINPFLALGSDKFKIVIIDQAERLNLSAANSLLKIIEEPPAKSFFFLISSEPYKIPITIRSRLQNIRFQTLPLDLIKSFVDAEDWVVQASQGRLDRLEEIQNQKELRQVAFDLWKKISEKGVRAYTLKFPDEVKKRKEALIICQYWQQLLRDARFMKVGESTDLIHADQKNLIEDISKQSIGKLDYFIKISLEMERHLRANVDCTLCFENFAIALQKVLTEGNL